MKRTGLVFLFVFIVSLSLQGFVYAEESQDAYIALHLGSPLIMDGDAVKSLDPDNPNVVPVIHNERTLVPLRSISEHFGAVVSYNAAMREAVIAYNGKSYIFPIGMNHYRIEEAGVPVDSVHFDTETLIMEDRTMVPLRVICEDVLGLEVDYMDRVITVAPVKAVLDSDMVEMIKARIGQALKFTSLAQLKSFVSYMDYATVTDDRDVLAPEAAESAAADTSAKESFSTTNEQVEGVNESDVVKTDGTFIYVALGKSVKIYKANAGNPILVDEIEAKVDSKTGRYVQLEELYIDDGRLVVLGTSSRFENWIRPIPMEETSVEMAIEPFYGGRNYTYCGIYAIDAGGNSSLLKEFEIDGTLLTSRKLDGTVHLVVNKYLYRYGIDDGDILPMYRDTAVSDDYKQLDVDKVLYYPKRIASNYLVIASIDIQDADEAASIEAFLGSGNTVYMSTNALYIAGQDYSSLWGSITNIAKFTVDGVKIGFAGGCMVEGSLLNQFSMDEYEGNLRVATTNWRRESVNAVYILDSNLNEIGAVENLAPGERIYSVRFLGDKGYIVTYRQIDPLFVLDLTDPESPAVVGELKVPGFSNYLHPISEDLLLGIGQATDETTGRQLGLKLSLFDVSDDGKPVEIKSLVLGDGGSYAEVLYNHKALMHYRERELIGFDATLTSSKSDYSREYFYGAVVLEVTEEGVLQVKKEISSEGIYGSYAKRLVCIGDILYYILDDNISSFDLDTL